VASRVETTKQVVAAIRAADPRPRVLVNGSAIGFYGDRGDEILDEGATAGRDFLADLVVAWERAARDATEVTRVVLFRTGLVLAGDAPAQIALRAQGIKVELGIDLLQRIVRAYPDVAVMMVTAAVDTHLAVQAMKLGAYDYVTKPFNLEELSVHVEKALERRQLLLENREHHRLLEQRVAEQTQEIRAHLALERQRRAELHHTLNLLEESYHDTIDALIMALDYRDNETQGHTQRVSVYTVELAQALGVGGSEMETIKRGAILHDIGKIGVSDTILRKPAKLTEQEWVEMKRHVEYGYNMLKDIAFLQDAAKIVLHHHERYDGGGYPNGLAAEQIPPGARIFMIADAFDAMTSNRSYRQAMAAEEALAEILRNSGTQFDPAAVRAFLSVYQERFVGSVLPGKDGASGQRLSESLKRAILEAAGLEKGP